MPTEKLTLTLEVKYSYSEEDVDPHSEAKAEQMGVGEYIAEHLSKVIGDRVYASKIQNIVLKGNRKIYIAEQASKVIGIGYSVETK